MKKTLFIITLILSMMMTTSIPATAAEYNFSGADPGTFGKPTSVEPDIVIGGYPTESDNINRSKDSAFIPPPFGSPVSNTLGAGEPLTPWISGMPVLPGSPGVSNTTYISADPSGLTHLPSSVEQTIVGGQSKFTLPDELINTDGSIGTLSISKLGVSAKVYEDESLENMAKSIGHLKYTSCWDGNVGFVAHNRGLADYFGQIHTLKNGDKIDYTTKLGTRTYEVFYVGQIQETDLSRLGRADENLVTLVTCVRDIPELRWCVQAREVT